MSLPAPPLDPRSADDVRLRLEALLNVYLKGLGAPVNTARGNGAVAALAGVFSRYAELIIERLNQVPDKNRLAFFELIGASLSPPQAARVPLSFSLAPGAKEATVPAGTPVAAPAGPGRDKPVLFETERSLAVTAARLTRLIGWDAPADRIADYGGTLDPAAQEYQVLFRGTAAVGRYFYVGRADLLGFPRLVAAYVDVELDPSLPATPEPRVVEWQVWDGQKAMPIHSVGYSGGGAPPVPMDATANLTLSGKLQFVDLTAISLRTVAGQSSRWLRCQLQTPLSPSLINQLPVFSKLVLNAAGIGGECLPDLSFFNQMPIDVSKDFYPFGDRAQFGATWYLASREVLSKAGLVINLHVPSSSGGIPRVGASADIKLIWEYWTGASWTTITADNGGMLSDLSNGLAGSAFGDDISFVLTQPPQQTRVNGVENYWLRVRYVQGGYATASQITADANAGKLTDFGKHDVGPSLAGATLSYRNTSYTTYEPDALVRFDGLSYQVLDDSRITPFAVSEDTGRSVYFGFELPAGTSDFPQRAVSLYLDLAAANYGDEPDNENAAIPPQLSWSYWAGDRGWQHLLVRDETGALSFSGLIEFLPPADFRTRALFDSSPCHWLRLNWASGDYRYLPRLRKVLQNAVMAIQASTVANEILGSSNGTADQSFTAARKPLLTGVSLEVREPALPSAAERALLIALEGDDAITPVAGGGAWVRWHEVGDFHGSAARDRHYVLDHLSGELRFGNGSSGLIPPRGAGNIRLARYASGGGSSGNAEAGAITQLKTTVPSVASVGNPLAAGGGVGTETVDALLERAPRSIRHRERAVTIEDFEDLARLASTEVARCRCVPLLDLREPLPLPRAGQLSLILVPVSASLQPTPSAELIARMQQFLDARRLPGIDLFVLGAEYVKVDVETVIGLKDLSAAREVELAVRAALEGFLHPLTGGFDGHGWDFGRHPRRSDLFALLEGIDGVDYVRSLSVTEITDPKRPDANQTDRFLVSSGNHSIALYYGV